MPDSGQEFWRRFERRQDTKRTRLFSLLFDALTGSESPDPSGPDHGYCGDLGTAAGTSYSGALWLVDHAGVYLRAILAAQKHGSLTDSNNEVQLTERLITAISEEISVPKDKTLSLVSRLLVDLGITLRTNEQDPKDWERQSTSLILSAAERASYSFSGSGHELFLLPWSFDIEQSTKSLSLDERIESLKSTLPGKIRAGIEVSEFELNNWAYFLLLIGRYRSATPMAVVATDMAHIPRNLDTLGWAHYFEENYNSALTFISEALELHEEKDGKEAWAEVAYHKLSVLLSLQRESEARLLLEDIKKTAISSHWSSRAMGLEHLLEKPLLRQKGESKFRKSQQFEYDVALSFAGEDREYAEILSHELTQKDVRVFYDDFEKAELWGKNLFDYLTDVYQNRARFCIMMVSQYYISKRWTNLERQAAQARAFGDDGEYVLPVRLDSSEVPGLLATVGYLDWDKGGVKEIVACMIKKLGR